MSREASLVLLASAGTGKTWRLTHRLIALFASDVKPARVLATTFTRKAAGEILQRLILRLCDAAESDGSAADLARVIRIDVDRADAREICVASLRGIDGLRISTLDAWFQESAQRRSFELGLPADWRICDAQLEQRVAARALGALLARPRAPQEWSRLLAELSGGGARSRVHEDLLSKLTQTAGFARDATEQAFDHPTVPPDVDEEDFQAALRALPKASLPRTQQGKPRERYLKALTAVLTACEKQDWGYIAGSTLVIHALDAPAIFDKIEIPSDLVAPLRVVFRRARHGLARGVLERNRSLRALLREYLREYERAARDERCMAFDALPRLLASAPPANDEGLDHLLLDEFQDTSRLQWRALEPWIDRSLDDGAQSLFCVGDVKQSIYSWRDGNPRLLAELPERLHLRSESLVENRRSTPAILDLVNRVFEQMPSHPRLAEEPERGAAMRFMQVFAKHKACREGRGRVRLWCTGDEAQDKASRAGARARLAVQKVVELRKAQPAWRFACLVRTGKQIPRLIEGLKRAGVDASAEGGNPLTDSIAVNVALSILEFADHPGDDFLWFHIANSELGRALGARWTGNDEGSRPARRELSARWRRLCLAEGPAAFLASLRPRVLELHGAFDRRRFAQLIALAQRLEPLDPLRPASFAQRLAQERVPDPNAGSVQVMTVHAAKGLEFDAVVLCDLDEPWRGSDGGVVAHRLHGDPRGPFDVVTHTLNQKVVEALPDLNEIQQAVVGGRIFEELCVLYVALTRAIHHLELIVDPPADPGSARTFAGLIARALAIEEPTEGLCFDSDPGAALARAEDKPVASRRELRTPLERRALAAAARRAWITPSREPASASAARSTRERWFGDDVARRAGTRQHRELEAIEWRDLQGGGPSWMSAPDVAALFSREATASRLGCEPGDLQVFRERRFAFARVREGRHEFVQGAIDRVVLAKSVSRAEIVDFKSGAAEQPEHHRDQLELYREALARLEGLEPSAIALKLCFTASGRVSDL